MTVRLRRLVALSMALTALLSGACPLTASPRTEVSGDVDVTFAYDDGRSATVPVDANLYLLSSLFNVQVENAKPGQFESPWTFYLSWQVTALDRFPVDSSGVEIDPYRYWVRYIGRRTETTLGMQKMVIGHARYLRPLQLFDAINPDDITKKTPGTKAVVVKAFPTTALQIHAWAVDNETASSHPHGGGRVNRVWDGGEAGLTFHHWEPDGAHVAEDVLGLDLFADVEVGLWLEHASHAPRDGPDWQQTTLGMDYTLPRIGNGLHLGLEHMVTTNGGWAQLDRATAFFLDTPLNDGDTLYASWRQDHGLGLRALNLRIIRDLSGSTTAELGFDWTNKDPDELVSPTGQRLPLRTGVSLRFVYSF